MGKKIVLLHCLVGILVTTSCSSLDSPTAQTHMELEFLKEQAARVNLTLEDLPEHFVEYLPEDGRMLGEDSLFDVQNEFSFRTEVGNLQTIIGMTTIYPYTQRDASAGMDLLRSQMDLMARSITRGFVIGKNVDVAELFLDHPVGDAYSGRTYNESMDDIGYPEYHTRTQVLVFERNNITVILLVQYVEELPVSVSILEMAEILDQRIQNLDSLESGSEY